MGTEILKNVCNDGRCWNETYVERVWDAGEIRRVWLWMEMKRWVGWV